MNHTRRLFFEQQTRQYEIGLLQRLLGDPVRAARLLEVFGSLDAVRHATVHQLTGVEGIGPTTAEMLVGTFAVADYTRKVDQHPRICSPVDAYGVLSWLQVEPFEKLVVLTLNTRNVVLDQHLITQGSINSAVVNVGHLFRPAILDLASAIIIAHGHPSGDPSPSSEDVRMTREVRKAGKLLDIAVLDHIIVGRGRFVSLKERSLGFD